MKKLKLSVLMTLLTFVALCAQGQANRLVIPDLTVQSGKDVQIPVKVDNAAEIVAIQFDLTVPEGIYVSPDVTLTDRSSGHKLLAKEIGNNTLRVMSYSGENSAFRGNSGTLIYINANAAADLPDESVHQLQISNAVLSTRSGDNVLTETIAGSITIAKSPDLAVSDVKVDKPAIAPGDTIAVSWAVVNIGGLPTEAGWKEQIYLTNSRTSKIIGTTYFDDPLANGGVAYRQAAVAIPEIVGIDGDVTVEVKLTPYIGAGEPVSAQANNTARSDATVALSKVLTLTLPPSIDESHGATVRCMLSRSGDTSEDGVFTITLTQADARATVPATVTIDRGQSSVYFYIDIKDNDELDDNDRLVLSVAGAGYDAITGTIAIIDDEIPSLTLTATPESITEGDELTLTITAERAPAADLVINLYCDAASRFRLPSSVTMAAGTTEVTLTVQSIDDQEVQSEDQPLFKVAAEGYEPAEAVITLADNDMPEIVLEITPAIVSEGAGYNAIMAQLRRLTKTENRVTVKLSDSSDGRLAYPTTIVLERGIELYKFNIGVNDNNTVDGDQEIVLTAAVYISSCDCTSAGAAGGEVSQTITILDNDGPSLSLVAATATWLEGTKDQILTITRNTPTDTDLTVQLTSDNDDLLEYEHTVVIPAGSASVEVPVTVKANDTTGDSATIVFTAEADAHSKGKCWVMISDQSLPDANVAGLTLDNDRAEVGTTITATVTIKNDGVVEMPAKTRVNLYISDSSEPAATLWTKSPLLPGDALSLDATLTAPARPGEYSVSATVNEEHAFAELTYSNNGPRSTSLTAMAAFTATVSVERATYLPGETLKLTGKATGSKTANAEVEVYLINSGRHTVTAVTDAEGNFTAEWTPYAQQSGHVAIGACYPGENLTTEMASADIYGLTTKGRKYVECRGLIGETFHGSFELVNGSSLPLTGVTATIDGTPDYCTINVNCPTTIDGGATATIEFTIDANAISEGSDWEYINIVVTTAEGLKVPMQLCYYCYNTKGRLATDVQSINTTMTKGSSRDYQFAVTNVGKGETGKIKLSLPQWMQAVTPVEMPSMAPGDTATVVLRFTPTDAMQLNGFETGAIAMTCANGDGLTIPFRIETVSETIGTLTIDICDESTYIATAGPHVAGATIVVRHPITGVKIAEGTTDDSGKCSFVLPEGYYSFDATADKHQTRTNINVLVDPGKETVKTITLSQIGGINLDFTVERIEVEDGYEFKLTMDDFQVDVPVPVVELSLPASIDLDNMAFGESLIVTGALTNKGLIMALDAELILPTDIPGVTFESLLDERTFDIAPQQSIFIPIRITKLRPDNPDPDNPNPDGPGVVPPGIDVTVKYPCTVTFSVVYYWLCGPDRKWHRYSVPVQIGVCHKNESTPAVVSSYGGGGGGGGGIGYGPIGGGGGGGGGGAYSSHTSVVITSDKGCEPCQSKLRTQMATYAKQRLGVIRDAWGCVLISDIAFDPVSPVAMSPRMMLDEYSGKLTGRHGYVGTFNNWHRLYPVAIAPLFDPCSTNPAYVLVYLSNLKLVADGANAEAGRFNEFFGDGQWMECDEDELGRFILAFKEYTTGGITREVLADYRPQAITAAQLDRFVERWHNTIDGVKSDNVMNADNLDRYANLIKAAVGYALQSGFDSVADFYADAEDGVVKELTAASNTVCSTISLQLSQTMTMTREAFLATLTVENGTDQPMNDIKLNIDVIDDEGRIATAHEFESRPAELDGFKAEGDLWSLAANAKGVARIKYIPTRYAAPDTARVYTFTGTLSYTDTYSGLTAKRDLFPVDVTVSPSPVLDMTYFMQRDVLGDDPLTEEVEPMIPAEFALLINNVGNGDAKNVKMVTNRPEVIANDKGLFIEFDLLSSLLNGRESSVVIDGKVPTDFGSIPAHSTAFAQWYFTGSLLGHFLDYNVEVNHLTSYGNQDLSLLGDVTIHELIRSLDLSDTEDERVTGFLVNDMIDPEDTPDNLYITDGTVVPVQQFTSMMLSREGADRYVLTVDAASTGWNYGHVVDPTAGGSTIYRVTRRSDGREINLRNVWQTDRTLRDGKEPMYERLIHIADCLAGTDEVYDIEFAPRPDIALAVEQFIGLPEAEELLTEPLTTVDVVFSKAVKAETFTTDDLSLNCQGRQLDASAIAIKAVNDRRYSLDVSALTAANGYYVLTVQTTGIEDVEGYNGYTGEQATWVQFRDGKVVLDVTANPAKGGTVTPASGAVDIKADVKLTAAPSEGYDFIGWRHNGDIVSTDTEYTVTVNGDEAYVAEFLPKQFRVNIDYLAEGGSVSGFSSGLYPYGTSLSLTSSARDGWYFAGWMVDGHAHSTDNTVDLDVLSDMMIAAVFVDTYRQITMSLREGWNWVSPIFRHDPKHNVKELLKPYTDVLVRVVSQDDQLINDPVNGLTGTLDAWSPASYYKFDLTADTELNIRGYVAIPEETPISLQPGWNWIGYVPTQTFALAEALKGLNAAEGDVIKDFDSFATYAEGAWQGTLTEMYPGQGYMYLSANAGEFAYPAINVFNMVNDSPVVGPQDPDADGTPWSVAARRYADNLALIATISDEDNAQYRVGAFVGDECRGVSQMVNGRLFITVHGDSAERVTFRAINMLDGEVYNVAEDLTFDAGIAGSYAQPMVLHVTDIVGIQDVSIDSQWGVYPNPAVDILRISGATATVGRVTVYALSGTKAIDINEYDDASGIDVSALPAGMYLIEISAADGVHVHEFIKK